MATLDPFYPVLDNSDWLERLVPLGIKLVQLRVKEMDEAATRAEIQRGKEICMAYDCQMIVNDYWQLAMELDCDYIHLGQEDLDHADIAAIKQANIRFGISTHSEDELERALSYSPDYIALGPVYPTILKEMPWQPQGLDRVSEWKAKIGGLPLVGIGGVNLERAPGILDAGADSVAMVTDITLNETPEQQVKRWLALTESYRVALGHAVG